MCVLLAGIYPVNAFADEPAPSTTTQPQTTVPAQNSSETTPQTDLTPSQAPAATKESTSTETAKPASEPKKTYYYDADTNHWNTDEWKYDPVSGRYQKPPAPVIVTPTETPEVKDTSDSTINAETKTQIGNALDSIAKSGDASVLKNTYAGDATSGNTSATATIINNVSSSLTNANNTEAAGFVTDITGDVNGDIVLQPLLLKAMLEAGASSNAKNQTINSTNATAINNDISLSAESGNATVAGNTKAGNATSGDANTVADVVNIVNSMISANQSFIGTINIYGNLNGDILVAPDFIPKLLASNGNTSTPTASSRAINSTNTANIVNNVALAANTGKAAVESNTSAGNATSGNADTNVVIFNLTGHEIVANNSLLVFVNVLGKWVGVIVDAPNGATAAAVGSGVKSNAVAPSLVINTVNDTQITNNITLASQTGDATVANNTSAGSATTGNATASANILNIANSQIGLTGWFGVLFINVYGTWLGSFGVDTSAGNIAAVQGIKRTTVPHTEQVFSYIPRVGSAQPYAETTIVSPGTAVKVSSATPAVKAAQVSDIPQTTGATPRHEVNVPLAIGSLLITLVSLYALRRFLF